MTNDTIALAANLALTLSVIIALVFGVVQIRAAARDRRERFALEALHNFQTREFVELLQYVNAHHLPSTFREMQSLAAADQTFLIQFAQQMESLGILAAQRYITMDLVDRTLGSFVVTSWKKYKAMMLDMREVHKDPFAGEYFQWLAERIDQQMRNNPRRPVYETGGR